MSAVAATISSVETAPQSRHRYIGLRICCWCVALALGALQAWATRFTMNPDGVSYLDIGDAYWRGDWHNAVNAYWSPLYSWILGFFLKVFKPSIYWEYPVVHLVNFLIYVAALGCFEYFLLTFIADRQRREAESLTDGEMGLPEPAWWLLGYSLFLSSSLILIGLAPVTPDMCVAGFVYLVGAIALRVQRDNNRRMYGLLGVVLGCAYLAKAAMFPIGIVFLAMISFAGGPIRIPSWNSLLAGLTFLAVAAPFIAALSYHQEHPTFSDVGPIAYEVYVDHTDQFIPKDPRLIHPVLKILESPAIYYFDQPISGTYPLWYDPTYWHSGIRPFFSARGQWQIVSYGFLLYLYTLLTSCFSSTALLLGLTAIGLSRRSKTGTRCLALPSFCAVTMYLLVYTESRYIAPFLLLLWLAGFSRLRFVASRGGRWLIGSGVLAMFLATSTQGVLATHSIRQDARYAEAAKTLSAIGVKSGDEMAVIGPEPFGEGGAFVARLARARVVAQSADPNVSWLSDPTTCAQAVESFRRTGVKALLLRGPTPSGSKVPWRPLDSTPYSFYVLDASFRPLTQNLVLPSQRHL